MPGKLTQKPQAVPSGRIQVWWLQLERFLSIVVDGRWKLHRSRWNAHIRRAVQRSTIEVLSNGPADRWFHISAWIWVSELPPQPILATWHISGRLSVWRLTQKLNFKIWSSRWTHRSPNAVLMFKQCPSYMTPANCTRWSMSDDDVSFVLSHFLQSTNRGWSEKAVDCSRNGSSKLSKTWRERWNYGKTFERIGPSCEFKSSRSFVHHQRSCRCFASNWCLYMQWRIPREPRGT